MPRSNKRLHTAAFKAKVALELLRREGELTSVCAQYQIHPTQARRWKRQALEGLELLFSAKRDNELKQKNELIEELYKQIGQLKVEHDWLKKISQAPAWPAKPDWTDPPGTVSRYAMWATGGTALFRLLPAQTENLWWWHSADAPDWWDLHGSAVLWRR